jgi:TonB family protein
MAPVALTKSDEPRLADVQKSLATAQIPLEVPAAVPIEAPPPAPVAAAPASAPVAAAPSPAVTVAAGGPAAAAPAPKPGATALAAAAAPKSTLKAATTAAPPTVAAAATPAAAPAVSAAAPAVAVATPAVMTMAMTSSAPSTSPEVSAPQPLPAAAPALPKDPEHPPRGLRIPSITALPDSQAIMNSDKCPYPVEARNRVETGTVELLVHVTPEGTVPNPQLSASSGSDSLDQAAISCIREFGRFPPKPGGPPKASYWGRTKFIWSFGD